MSFLESMWSAPLRVVATIILAVLIYLCLKAVIRSFQLLQEIFVIWTIFFGHSWKPKAKNMRIHPYFCKTNTLDEDVIDECFRFHFKAFTTPSQLHLNVDQQKEKYRQSVLSFSHLLLCRDRDDGSLRGLMLLNINRKKTHTEFNLGMMLFDSKYRGGPWMRLAGTIMILRELVLHPLTPLYTVVRVSTYKPFLLLHIHRQAYPHPKKETPELFKKIAEEYVRDIKGESDGYDRDTMVLKRRVGTVRESTAPITEKELQNPYIKFFNERNANWREGDQLVAVIRMSWIDYYDTLVATVKQALYSGKDRSTVKGGVGAVSDGRRPKKPVLKRGLTFQDWKANEYAAKYSTIEYGETESSYVSSPSLILNQLLDSPVSPVEFDISLAL